MENIKVSVIIPMLNSIKYLNECLESICNQTLKDIEIICVDAGSTDGTLELVSSFINKDKRVILLRSEKKSYGAQLNKGIKIAKGEYIGTVDSDDYILPEMYMNLYEKTLENKPDFIKGGHVQFGNINEKLIYEKKYKKDVNLGKLIDLNENPKYRIYDMVHIWSGIYKKEFLLKNDIKLNETPGASFQDTSFAVITDVLARTCIYTDNCDYYYRIDNINSSVKSDSKFSCIVDEYDYIFNEINKRQVKFSYIEKVKQYKLTSYFWNYCRLSSEGRKKFLEIIHSDMMEYLARKVNLSKNDQIKLDYLSDAENEKEYLKYEDHQQNCLKKVCDLVENNQKCICVSAGQYGEIVIKIQEMYGKKIVETVCDNNKDLYGVQFEGYIIKSVEQAVKEYKDHNFIVCNKNHANEIKNQLISFGINKEQVIIIDNLPNFLTTFNYIKKKLIPKISVLMPSLNMVNYIEQSLYSVLNQTFKELEIICIDAGSTDGTLEILEKYKEDDDRITIINSDKRSYGYQMNIGIRAAQGEYIGIVETDDIIEQYMFEELYNIARNKNPDYVKGNAVQFYEKEAGIQRTLSYYPYSGLMNNNEEYQEINPSDNPELFLSDNFIWNGIYRNEFLKKIIFQETPGAAFQDISVLFKVISSASKAIYVNKNIYLYRQDNYEASSYNKKSIIYANDEYERIIKDFLQDLSEEWKKIFYKKMVLIILNRFRIMAQSGIFWQESESGMEGMQKKLKFALTEGIISEQDFSNENWKGLKKFIDDPKKLFNIDYEYYKNIIEYIHSIREAIGINEFIIFGCGDLGKYLADMLQIYYEINPRSFWDNDSLKWGKYEKKILIDKPQKPDGESIKYIIANKKYMNEIKEQLLSLKISHKQIIEFNIEKVDKRLYYTKEIFNQIKNKKSEMSD